MPRLKIAVYSIALNERKFCDRYYASCADADLVVVADTGSTDGTPERLRALGAVVHQITVRPFRFDLAREAALALLPSDLDLCISLDLDEVLVSGWRQALEAAWRPDGSLYLSEMTASWNADGSAGMVYSLGRTHLRHGFRWVYACHEELEYIGPGQSLGVTVRGFKIHQHADPVKIKEPVPATARARGARAPRFGPGGLFSGLGALRPSALELRDGRAGALSDAIEGA